MEEQTRGRRRREGELTLSVANFIHSSNLVSITSTLSLTTTGAPSPPATDLSAPFIALNLLFFSP